MFNPFSTQNVVSVAFIAILIPVLRHAFASRLFITFSIPFLGCAFAVVCLTWNIGLGYYLDSRRPARLRRNLATAARPLGFSTPAAWQAVLTRSRWSHKPPQSLPPLVPDMPQLSAAISSILILIVRDFVLVWYKEISGSPSFPTAVSGILHESLDTVKDRVVDVDFASLVVRKVIPKITSHIEQFRQSEMALRGAGLERHLTQSDELDLLLASRYAGNGGKLHPAVDNLSSMFTKQTEETHLRQLIDKALPHILPSKDAQSKAVTIVAREIVACAVLSPLFDMLADPDFWNTAIDQIAGAAIRQQKLISKVRGVLEAQSLGFSGSKVQDSHPASSEVITLRTDPRQFESFLRSINRCNSLLDARRLKNDILGEIRRTRTLLAKHENEDWIDGEKTEDVVAFLDRLYTAKRKVDKRIVLLGGEDDSRIAPSHEPSESTQLSLRDVLTGPSSLSYFMEFMDRRGRSLLVQFWLAVESFKNPLESVASDSSGSEDENVLDITIGGPTMKEDMTMIVEFYFSSPQIPPALSAISTKHVDTIRAYVKNSGTPSPSELRKVRRSVLLAQRQVEQDLEHDFEDFKRSELWFKTVAEHDPQPRRGLPSVHSVAKPPVPKRASSSSSNLFSSLVHGLSLEGVGLSRSKEALAASTSSLTGPSKRRESWSSSRSPMLSPGLPAGRVGMDSNLEILMAPSPEADSRPSSRAPLFDDPDNDKLAVTDEEARRMEAIQAAVTDIIASENRENHGRDQPSSSESLDIQRPQEDSKLRASKRRVIFSDNVEDIDEALDSNSRVDDPPFGTFQLAGPGDLYLSHEIARLGEKISNLQSQGTMLDTLIRKAELTGDVQELSLLRKSKSALGRELRQLTFQKTQYEQQESANRLVPGRTKVSIVDSANVEEDGKQVVRYLIEVQQLAPDGTFTSGWVVARRYNEFFTMHQKLREKYLMVKNLDFPGKRLVTALSSSLVDSRRTALEQYLQNLLGIPIVCESEELRAFLSQQTSPLARAQEIIPKETSSFPGQNLVRNVYRSFTESLDDIFSGPSMLDVMIGRLTRQAAEFAGIVGQAVTDEDLVTNALRASGKVTPEESLMHLPGDLKPLGGETSNSSFSAPICDLILAVFELDKKNNWLRRQAIVIILQQVLGDTIERKVRDTVKGLLDEPHLVNFANIFKDNMWPSGQLKPPAAARTPEEKFRTREEANRKLSALVPDVAANMIGRSNARRGARRIFAVLQNRRLNQHIIYTVLDEIFAALFPDIRT